MGVQGECGEAGDPQNAVGLYNVIKDEIDNIVHDPCM